MSIFDQSRLHFSVCLACSLIDGEEGKVLTAKTSSCDLHNDMSTSDKQTYLAGLLRFIKHT